MVLDILIHTVKIAEDLSVLDKILWEVAESLFRFGDIVLHY